MIDFHTHILPNVDDGAKSILDSIKMIERELECGVNEVYLTPHHIINKYQKSKEEIISSFNTLNEEIKSRNLDIKLHLGMEIYYSEYENVLEKLKKGELLTLGDTNYVLLEFSYTYKPRDFEEIIYNFKVNGYKVIIAHIERYTWMTLNDIKFLKSEGAIISINADSILNLHSRKEFKITKKLLKLDLVDIIASDTHIFRLSNLDKVKEKYGDIKELNYTI